MTPNTTELTPQHHANLASLLAIMEHLGAMAFTLAPIVAAPFVKNQQAQAILQAEAPLSAAIGSALGSLAAHSKAG